jgi:hypothetical protein
MGGTFLIKIRDTAANCMKLPWKIKLTSGFKLDLTANFAGVG